MAFSPSIFDISQASSGVVVGRMHSAGEGHQGLGGPQSILKAWGRLRPLFLSDRVELVEIIAQKGGYSSRHVHLHKSNAFLVVKGRLYIACYEAVGVTQRILTPDTGPYVVPAGVDHRFIALDDPTEALEIYYAASSSLIDPNDIVRQDSGGVLSPVDDQAWTMSDAELIRSNWGSIKTSY